MSRKIVLSVFLVLSESETSWQLLLTAKRVEVILKCRSRARRSQGVYCVASWSLQWKTPVLSEWCSMFFLFYCVLELQDSKIQLD